MFKALVIRPSEAPEIVKIESSEHLKRIVGGYLEFISFTDSTGCYIHEEAKIPPNIPILNGLATSLCNSIGTPLRTDDYIAGSMVIFGVIDENGGYDGEEHDIPEDVLTLIQKRINMDVLGVN